MKRIQVLVNFGGAETGEQRILPGEYDIDAPELFGVGEYLLENGFAVEVPTVRVIHKVVDPADIAPEKSPTKRGK